MPSVKWIKNLCGDKTKTYTKEPWILASACTVSEHWWIEKKTKIQGQTFLNRPFQTSSGWTHIKLSSSTLKLHLISSLITPHLMPLFFASCFCILFFMSANIELSPIFFVYCCCSHYFLWGRPMECLPIKRWRERAKERTATQFDGDFVDEHNVSNLLRHAGLRSIRVDRMP